MAEDESSFPSKSARKRFLRLERLKTHRKEVDKRKKEAKRALPRVLDPNPDRLCKRERIQAEKEHLRASLQSLPRVAIDCAYEHFMSEKELNKTRSQVQRCYSLLKRTELKNFHLHLSNLPETSALYKSFLDKTAGFEGMYLTRFAGSIFEQFPAEDLVYLTPDSPHPLTEISLTSVYVIGGFVDDNIKRNTSLDRCLVEGVRTARLPIQEHYEIGNHKQCVLTINQVFEVLLMVHNGMEWAEALDGILPKRKAYLP